MRHYNFNEEKNNDNNQTNGEQTTEIMQSVNGTESILPNCMEVTIISLRALEKHKMVYKFLLVDRRKRSNKTDDMYLPFPFSIEFFSFPFFSKGH